MILHQLTAHTIALSGSSLTFDPEWTWWINFVFILCNRRAGNTQRTWTHCLLTYEESQTLWNRKYMCQTVREFLCRAVSVCEGVSQCSPLFSITLICPVWICSLPPPSGMFKELQIATAGSGVCSSRHHSQSVFHKVRVSDLNKTQISKAISRDHKNTDTWGCKQPPRTSCHQIWHHSPLKNAVLCVFSVFCVFFDMYICVFVYPGSQYREIVCVNRHTEQEVHERRCDSATKPVPEEEPCNVHPCPPLWVTVHVHTIMFKNVGSVFI